MAELLKIRAEVEHFRKEYFYRNCKAEENRRKETQAATRIQSGFRACRVRAYLSHLHKKAIIIQKVWRGFTARARVRQMVKAAYFIMKMNFYEEMAVRIQRQWRGFFVRKYIHNFYERKSYMEGLIIKNELIRRELDEIEVLQKKEREYLQLVKEKTEKISQAHRLHHLISTKQSPGVFNSPFRPAPDEMELLLRQVKYQAPTKLNSRGRGYPLDIPGPTAPGFSGSAESPWIKSTRACSFRPILPPISTKKPQGLFSEPGEVWEQSLQCPDLMLCLQTSYTHLEEAQGQLWQHESVRLPSVVLGSENLPQLVKPCSSSFKQ
ncbi:spermatogenesis-associated protein 17 isoform 1-T2 [Menidia menidia]